MLEAISRYLLISIELDSNVNSHKEALTFEKQSVSTNTRFELNQPLWAHMEAVGRGTILDETPWLGPFQVHWDYHNEIPSFYGLVGILTTALFLSQTSVQYSSLLIKTRVFLVEFPAMKSLLNKAFTLFFNLIT